MEDYQSLYQSLYRRLFALVIAPFDTEEADAKRQEEADEIRREMDMMPGSNADKTTWGHAAVITLYQRHVYD